MLLKQFLLKELKFVINDIARLISIKTFRIKKEKIYQLKDSKSIKKSFQIIEMMCKRDGLEFRNYDNKVAVITLNSKSKKEFALLHHIDTIPIFEKNKWISNPFKLKKINDFLYGRGVNDNKGPLIFSYYIFKYIKEHKNHIPMNLKIVIGSAEETTWEGINFYKTIKKEPDFAISPDGNFPLVNNEMGIYQILIEKRVKNNNMDIELLSPIQHIFTINEIILTLKFNKINFTSHKEKSRNSMRIINETAFDNMYQWFEKNYEMPIFLKEIKQDFSENNIISMSNNISNAKINVQDSLSITSINLKNNLISLGIDIRYFFTKKLTSYIQNLKNKNWNIRIIKHLKPHKVSKHSDLVKSFLGSYNKICQTNLKPLTFSGASYARAFKNAVAFGTTFENEKVNSHLPNEQINLVNMIKSSEIIFEGIKNISKIRRL